MAASMSYQMRLCHYCYGEADTRDHIVPRSRVTLTQREMSASHVKNTVPACFRCNQTKADQRSTCDCAQCLEAWALLGPVGWAELPRVEPTQWRLHRFERSG